MPKEVWRAYSINVEAKANRESTKTRKAFQAERESNRNDFISQTDSLFNSNFEGFKVQLGNEKDGFEDFTIKPENLR
jgi:hypothetical protein